VPWPRSAAGSEAGDRVAIVVVNYQTRELVSQLVFSLQRILGRDQFAALVVVDNASSDGSDRTLAALADAGLLHLIRNHRQRYHGPALNQAISWLARRQASVSPGERIDFVWALDSDVVVLRREVVRDAVATFRGTGAAIIGEGVAETRVALNSLMLDPAKVWRRSLPPFDDSGSPDWPLQQAVAEAGLEIAPFHFNYDSYVLHLGRGTMGKLLEAGERDNRFYDWASEHREPHYSDHPLGRRLHEAVLRLYEAEVADDSPDALVEACGRPELFRIAEARPLPPMEELVHLHAQGVDLTEHLARRFRAEGD
jgi:hypothetical protein